MNQKLFHSLESSLAVVVNHLIVSLLDQLDSWESLHLHILQFISCRVQLGDHNVHAVLVVSAPRSVELDQHVLGSVRGHLLEVVSDQLWLEGFRMRL